MPPQRQQGIVAFFGGGKRKNPPSPSHPPTDTTNIRRSRFGDCPLCQKSWPMHLLVAHAERCVGISGTMNSGKNADEEEGLSKARSAQNDTVTTCATLSTKSTSDGMTALPLSTPPLAVDSKSESDGNLPMPWWKQSTSAARSKRRRLATINNPIAPTSQPIPGLFLYHDFLTAADEHLILSELDHTDTSSQKKDPDRHQYDFLPWKFARFNGDHLGKRWGVHCNLRDRRVGAAEHPLPHFLQTILLPKLAMLESMMGCVPNEANAIDYRRRQGHYLQRHVDDRQLSKEPIANLSIAGDCYMTFRNEKNNVNDTRRILLPRRTLQVLTGKARYDYSHAIRNEDLLSDRRVSITMRESPLTDRKA